MRDENVEEDEFRGLRQYRTWFPPATRNITPMDADFLLHTRTKDGMILGDFKAPNQDISTGQHLTLSAFSSKKNCYSLVIFDPYYDRIIPLNEQPLPEETIIRIRIYESREFKELDVTLGQLYRALISFLESGQFSLTPS